MSRGCRLKWNMSANVFLIVLCQIQNQTCDFDFFIGEKTLFSLRPTFVLFMSLELHMEIHCRLPEQTNTSLFCLWNADGLDRPFFLYNNNNNLLHLYSAFLDTQSALHSKGAISSSTTNVQHPPGWCNGSHSAPECPPHTSLVVERRQSDEANQCMGMIRRPWWSEASGLVWPGCRGNTPTLFRRTSWDF